MRSPLVLAVLALSLSRCGSPAPRARHAAGRTDASAECRRSAVALQVLGSGGPIADDDRASSGYLVWVHGRPRVLVDAGPGVMLRLGESGADLTQLDAVLLTHLHVDHAADVAGLLKTMSFGTRRASLPFVGPTGEGDFPGVAAFLDAILAEDGAFHYLRRAQAGGLFPLTPHEVQVAGPAVDVLDHDGLRARAVGVPHGPVPALAYEVSVEGHRIAFMGDQRADEPRYVDMIRGADLLVAHMAIGPGTEGVAARLHATPARLGEVAAEADVGSMVLSHLMRRSLAHLDESLATIRGRYDGPLQVAEDGMCVRVASESP